MRVRIVYASLTGNTEEVADYLVWKLNEMNIETESVPVEETDISAFDDVEVAIVATYTYGQGDLPDEIVEFYDALGEVDLSGKLYAVVGTGDSTYDDFCKSVEDFESQFERTGATQVALSVKIENEPLEEDKEVLDGLAEAITVAIS